MQKAATLSLANLLPDLLMTHWMPLLEMLVYYLIAMNLAAFSAFGIDKSLAENGQWRISEATLILLATFGGMPGALAGRSLFRHKTKKRSFNQKLLASGVMQVAAVGGIAFLYITRETPEDVAARKAVERSVYYSGCNSVRAAGRAPLLRGEPGYRSEMDGDGDGVACEPVY